MSAAEDLITRWRDEGIELNAGASAAELDDLRTILGRELPEDVRQFYALVNGMPDLIYDAHFVSFWSIGKIRQELGKWSSPEIGFADFFIQSWRFILRADDAGVTVLWENVAPGQPPESLGRFGDFLDAYQTDPSRFGMRTQAR
jgi:hypothetical protein